MLFFCRKIELDHYYLEYMEFLYKLNLFFENFNYKRKFQKFSQLLIKKCQTQLIC